MFGPGLDGNRPRCAPFWDDFFACVVKNGRNEQWALCKEQREDFMECLHHKKLVRFSFIFLFLWVTLKTFNAMQGTIVISKHLYFIFCGFRPWSPAIIPLVQPKVDKVWKFIVQIVHSSIKLYYFLDCVIKVANSHPPVLDTHHNSDIYPKSKFLRIKCCLYRIHC